MHWLYVSTRKEIVNVDNGNVIRESAIDDYEVKLYFYGDNDAPNPITLGEFQKAEEAYKFIESIAETLGAKVI